MNNILNFLLLTLVFFSFNLAYAGIDLGSDRIQCSISNDPNMCLKKVYTKKVILQKRTLEKEIKNGGKYVIALDAFFEKYSNDREKIEAILERVKSVQVKLDNTTKDKQVYEIIKYIEYRGELVLLSLPDVPLNIENLKDLFNLTEEELERYLEALTIQELEDIANNFYENESDLYKAVIELYETQIQKARDTRRISDIKTLQGAVEQTYQDTAEYPTKLNFEGLTSVYMPRTPKDPLAGFTISGCNFGYRYEVGTDANGIRNGNYRISTCFEHPDNIQKRADNSADEGDDNLRLEIGYWDENTVFTEDFYINDISRWENVSTDYSSASNGNLDDLNEESQRGILYYVIYLKYLEENPEILEAYNTDARNATVSSHIRTLISAFEIALVYGNIDFDALITENGRNSFNTNVGTIYSGEINYTGLEQNKDNFESPWDGYDYIGAYLEDTAGNQFYQLLGYKKIDTTTYEVIIKGNYLQLDSSYPDSLFKNPNTGEYFKNGDTLVVK